ncbi:Myb-like_DNA-binding domain-containing protein [Hexamita inflata]|uniref:Myb-like_DNA-binding domain-containing protein n=1 Tax=Hexamita inflata TaxID=28002 RepID=A0ABP1KPX6_9EUKA
MMNQNSNMIKEVADLLNKVQKLCINTNNPSLSSIQSQIPTSNIIVGTNDHRIRWKQSEHVLFLDAIEKYGRIKHSQISNHIKTRSTDQVVSHSQKMYEMMGKICVSVLSETDFYIKYYQPVSHQIDVPKLLQNIHLTGEVDNVSFQQIQQPIIIEKQLVIPLKYSKLGLSAKKVQILYCSLFSYVQRKSIVIKYIVDKIEIEGWLVELCLLAK